jgi:hypothetical protein
MGLATLCSPSNQKGSTKGHEQVAFPGGSLFLGGESTPSRVVVQSAGHGYGLKASALRKEFDQGGALQHLALRYTQALITQMA